MTRKHFKELARIVREQHQRNGFDEAVWLCKEFVKLCKESSQTFLCDYFIKECGLEGHVNV